MTHFNVSYRNSWVFIQCVEHPEINLQLPYDPKVDDALPEGTDELILAEMVEFGVADGAAPFEKNFVNEPPEPEPDPEPEPEQQPEPDPRANVPVEIFKAVEE